MLITGASLNPKMLLLTDAKEQLGFSWSCTPSPFVNRLCESNNFPPSLDLFSLVCCSFSWERNVFFKLYKLLN